MYGKPKNNAVPSDSEAREKLATYVYEYLMHVGASKAAVTFLQEIGWDKNIQVAESPGFLHSWWCVFWDLYCASPEKRDVCEHSTEAKVFYEYSSTSAPSSNPMPPDGMAPGMPHGYFSSFMSPRYSHGAPRSGMQGPGGPQQMMQGMDHSRPGQMMGMGRMVHPRGIPPSSMNPYGSDQFQQPYGNMRMPSSSPMPNHAGMSMPAMHTRPPWPNHSTPPGPSPVGMSATPMMRSPQDPMNSEYVRMKQMQHQPMPGSFPMGPGGPENLPPSTMPGPQGQGMPVSTPNLPAGLNEMNGSGPDPAMMNGLSKSSPGNNIAMNSIGPGGPPPMGPPGGPGGTAHTPQDGEGDSFNMNFGDNDQNDTAAILKIKESMQQGAKLFQTKDADPGTGSGADFDFIS